MLTCLRCGNQWEPRKTDALPKRCPGCMNSTWNTPYKRKPSVPRGTFVENVDKPKENAIIESVNVPIDPDGAMMQATPIDRVAEAKRKAMELFQKVASA